ncbi:serine/threonine/tyrosine-interacting-like protein 2 [Xenopus laevis]|uniref:Serine/threonine/tyrosine-interacting-like protein 2 n=1 Tax=Xenopus laevis TaxID=8355 RepID=A0A8J0UC24_XENLA|nr:serine/threonine/tyrosine-interacting-like protein 2 [Xenopus laevis]
MATGPDQEGEQVVPDEGAEDDVRAVQAHYLRSPSPSSFSMLSDAYTESIFLEPIHLSSFVAAKQIINEELKPKEVKVDTVSPGMLETAEQLMVEDLYNRVKEKIDDRSLFNTPCVLDLQRELIKDRLESPLNAVDEVWPNVFIAEKSVAVNKGRLKRMGITHILNAGHGTTVFTGPDFYSGMNIQYMGVEVDDFQDSDISKFLRPAAEFLDEALLTYRGKVLVNSEMGVSRSAVLVAAYLMIFHHMTILEALMTMRKKRAIYPNDAFIMQLRDLNEKLLEDREYSDQDDDTNSQGSVVEAKASSIRVEEEDVESIMGAKVHSITVEEEDTTSVMGSVMSIMEKASMVSKQPTLIDEDEEEKIYEEWRRKQGLPPKDISKKPEKPDLPEEGEVCEDYVKQMIHEWQSQNEKYQSHKLDDDDDGSSLMGGRPYSPSEFSDVSSVTSQQIQALKRKLEASGINRMSRGRSDSVSTDSTWDMWNERLQEIEKEARAMADKGDKKKERDVDEESVFSDTSSLFNFCKKNKDKLTPLQRWQIKRIQFGYHKKDSEASDAQSKQEGAGAKQDDETSQSDVNVTAYQEWKMKHQQKLGSENKDEIVEIGKVEDTATVKRRQRRAEIIERSKQNLEESQSICGWDTASSISGSIPLTAFFPVAPSASGVNDAASVLSMQSNRSGLSQARSLAGQPSVPMVPTNMTPGAPDAISMASIQNWIANVVSETIAQKQNEIMMMSRAPSVLSMASGDVGKKVDDDKSSLFGAAGGSCLSNSALQHRDLKSTDSVLSCNTSTSTDISSSKRKITQTSKPYYGLFLDDVDLKKLNQKENEIREEISGKMSKYQKERIVSSNKRSTAYKKKKAKDTEADDETESFLSTNLPSYKPSSGRDYSKLDASPYSSYCGRASTASSELEKNVSKWLTGVKTEERTVVENESRSERYSSRSEYQRERESNMNGYEYSKKITEEDKNTRTHMESTRDSRRYSNVSEEEEEEESHSFRTSKMNRNYREDSPDLGETSYDSSNTDLANTRPRTYQREDAGDSDNSDTSDIATKRKYNHSMERNDEGGNEEGSSLTESRYSTGRRSQFRKRKEEAEGADDDDIIAAWRNRQEETKTRLRRYKEEN